jgi:hypothetical protein
LFEGEYSISAAAPGAPRANHIRLIRQKEFPLARAGASWSAAGVATAQGLVLAQGVRAPMRAVALGDGPTRATPAVVCLREK